MLRLTLKRNNIKDIAQISVECNQKCSAKHLLRRVMFLAFAIKKNRIFPVRAGLVTNPEDYLYSLIARFCKACVILYNQFNFYNSNFFRIIHC